MSRVEVKTSFKNRPKNSRLFGYVMEWVMDIKHENIDDNFLFYCFVNIEKDTNTFRFFVVPNNIVSTYVRNQHLIWLNRKGNHPQTITNMRTFRIGL